ncbi:hypothetical protein [Pseudomonas sp. R5(2019)]|uniref:hypothetical protein n=1 Tax=Pseudomonas sp. R5(2019) TaxID=2697566 RepID=UPI0021147D11|nr:hypothetical protein [Pseudomonas sp. R5(2019)]
MAHAINRSYEAGEFAQGAVKLRFVPEKGESVWKHFNASVGQDRSLQIDSTTPFQVRDARSSNMLHKPLAQMFFSHDAPELVKHAGNDGYNFVEKAAGIRTPRRSAVDNDYQ